MTVQRFVLTLAGSLILVSIALALLFHPAFLILAAFVGVNLLQSAYTGFCPLAIFLRALGMQDAAGPPWARSGAASHRRFVTNLRSAAAARTCRRPQ